MSIKETIAALENVKQEDLHRTGDMAMTGATRAIEFNNLLNAFARLLGELPFAQMDDKLTELAAATSDCKTQCEETADKLVDIVGDTDNEHAGMAVSVNLNMAESLGSTHSEDGSVGTSISVNRVREDLVLLQDMVTAMRARLEQASAGTKDIITDFIGIGGASHPEARRKLRLSEDQYDGVTLAKMEITAYQKHLSS